MRGQFSYRGLPRRAGICLLVLLCCWAAEANTRLVLPNYVVEAHDDGTVRFLDSDGTRLVTGLRFKARYFTSGRYLDPAGAEPSLVDVSDLGDTVLITGRQDLGPVRADVRILAARSSPIVECGMTLTCETPVDSVLFETVEFDIWPEPVQVLGRDLGPARPPERGSELVLDRWTTRAGRFGQGQSSVTILGEDNLIGLRLRRDRNHWTAAYDIDRANDHPRFRNYCWAANRASFDSVACSALARGTVRERFFRLAIGRPARIIKRERQPDGYEASLVLTEHADCEGAATSRAIAYGSSAATAPIPGRGILGNGLTWTKSVFRWSTPGTHYGRLGSEALDCPEFRQVVDELHAQGVEIALHSPTALADSSSRAGQAVRDMKAWYGTRVWIDHGMDNNLEALSKFGADPESLAWFIAETLAKAGIDYVWQASDIAYLGGSGTNLFTPDRPAFYPPILYPIETQALDRPCPRLYLWPANAVNDNRVRNAHLGASGLDRLVRTRGIDILHLYFAGQDTYVNRPRPAHAEWLVPSGRPPDLAWETDSKVDRFFQDIARRQAAGQLRVTTLSALADYLLTADSVEIRTRPGKPYLVLNHAGRPVTGLALSTDADGVGAIYVDNREVRTRKTVGPDIVFWFDVPADTWLELRIEAPVLPNPFGTTARIRWQMDQSGWASVRVISQTGRLVRTLSRAWLQPGDYEQVWDGHDDYGREVGSGSYTCLVQAGSSVVRLKLVKLR